MSTLPSPPPDVLRGGLVMTLEDKRFFLGADVAQKLAPRPQITHLPGSPPGLLGLALHEGAIVPVLDVGPGRGAMIVCLYRGEHLGVLGADSIVTGVYDRDADGAGVVFEGEKVPPLDLEALYARVHSAAWGSTWGM